MLVQVADIPLGRAIMRIAGRYAREMQRHRATTGHFFERRYRAILVDADSYLLELIRYIHLNPVRAGIVQDPDCLPLERPSHLPGLEDHAVADHGLCVVFFASELAGRAGTLPTVRIGGRGIAS